MQVVEWARLGFGPTGGGYASVFVGWTGFYFLFALIALLFVEVQFANAVRKGGSSDGARLDLVLLVVPRRDRRRHLGRPLPRLMSQLADSFLTARC